MEEIELSAEMDVKEVNKAFEEFYKTTSRNLAEWANTHLYYIARNAVQETHHATKGQITKELNAPSVKYPKRPLKFILASKKKGKGSGKLTGDEVRKFQSGKTHSANFGPAGWIPCIKALAQLVDKKYKGTGNTAALDTRRIQHGRDKGEAKPLVAGSDNMTGYIWNKVRFDKQPPKLMKHLVDGLHRAIARELKSMEEHANSKLQSSADTTINK